MKPSGRVLRSASRLLVQCRPCSGVAPPCNARSFSRGFEEVGIVPVLDKFVGGGEWGRVAREEVGLRRALPSLPSARLQRRGFLSCGDGDEDSGVARHFEEDRVIGYVPPLCDGEIGEGTQELGSIAFCYER